ncbi:TetR/AcrR family transcriptional regulator [Fundidesulfovibrio soli]|uniref:TetR/AcrR family transcriptional regulator n=1 Tax=Fundidesulfovibrio soli TaxID=2922716 RepID=UPI001FAFE120|nr:TetR/AcrR family transcriptional regulator [Fundidesulfovibrio soli]
MTQSALKRPPGRPRSDAARKAILDAANSLLEESGYAKLSMEGIAARAGVSKATIYRWWPTKGAVAMEAFLGAISPRIAFPHTESAIADVTTQMRSLVRAYLGVDGRVVCELIALGQSEPETLASFVDGYLKPRRNAAKDALLRGVKSGEIRPDLDMDMLVDALYGPIFNRLLVRHLPLDEDYAEGVARIVFSGAGASAPASR